MDLERFEVRSCLALHLDPGLLLANGATFTGGDRGRARGPHYFVCIEVRGRETLWIACSSKPAPGRTRLVRKFGHPCWMDGDTYVDVHQVWSIDVDVVRLVARSTDRSRRGDRNHADLRCLYTAA